MTSSVTKQTGQVLRYMHRYSGIIESDILFASGFWHWAYNTRLGLFLTRHVISRPIVSTVFGAVMRRRFSRRWIEPFIQKYQVDMTESLLSAKQYYSFNDFFVREINLTRRPICPGDNVCVSPVDGRYLVFPELPSNKAIIIKRTEFTVRALLRDEALISRYSGGAVFVGRLVPQSYHRVHFPFDCVPGKSITLQGRHHALTPFSQQQHVPIYDLNHRIVSQLKSAAFGNVCMVEIGGFAISSIRQLFTPDVRIEKGSLKCSFNIGGSTVVLLFEPGAITADLDLVENSANDIETYVRMGDQLGTRR